MADEQYFTKMVDGQLSVATVAQNGEIIPEEDRPGDKYTTAMVQTSDGPQLCVKTYDMNGGGGGGGGTVDQTYDPTSTNAQSGTAVAEAVAPSLKNKVVAGALNAVVINPEQINDLGISGVTYNSILIRDKNQTYSLQQNQTVVGASAGGTSASITCVGRGAEAQSAYCTAIGNGSYTSGGTNLQGGGATAVGDLAIASHGTALGAGTQTSMAAVAIGRGYNSSHRVEASGARSIAIGVVISTDNNDKVAATAQNAIQLGTGVNSTANTFQVYSYPMLDGTTGKIPSGRLPDGLTSIYTEPAPDTTHFTTVGTPNVNNIFTVSASQGSYLQIKPNVDTANVIVLKVRYRFTTNSTSLKHLLNCGPDGSPNTTLPFINSYSSYDFYYSAKQSAGSFPGTNWRNLTLTLDKTTGSLTFYQTDDSGNVTDNWSSYTTGTGRTTTVEWFIRTYTGESNSNIEVDLTRFSLTEDGTEYPYLGTGQNTYYSQLALGNSLSVSDSKLNVNLTDITGYNASATQVLKNVNGVLTWVTEA